MDNFLRSLRQNLDKSSTESKPVHIVIGNESCDMDSAVSALVFAYFSHVKDERKEMTHIPVLNIPRSEYRLRRDIQYVLSELFGDVEKELIFVNEIPLDKLFQQKRLIFTLVDHHKLSSDGLNQYGAAVRQVIDHHRDNEPDRTSYRRQCIGEEDGFPRYVTSTVGSCSTLIAERILDFRRRIPSTCVLDEKVAKLLLGAILIDTSDLKNSTKTTKQDSDVVQQLLAQGKNFDRSAFYEAVIKAKLDVGGMSVVEILAKDYKVIRAATNANATVGISSIGMSTVQLSFQALSNRSPTGQGSSSLEKEFEKFRQEKHVDALVLSCIGKEIHIPDDRKKQVVIYGGSENDKNRMFCALSAIEGMRLSPADFSSASIRVYWQENPGLSRKQLLPALEILLKGS